MPILLEGASQSPFLSPQRFERLPKGKKEENHHVKGGFEWRHYAGELKQSSNEALLKAEHEVEVTVGTAERWSFWQV